MDVVYATATTHVTTPGGARVVVHKGTHWPVGDPIVRAQPSLFSDDPRWGMTYTVEPDGFDAPIGQSAGQAGEAAAPVEQATAAPGERRSRSHPRNV